jgi:integrase
VPKEKVVPLSDVEVELIVGALPQYLRTMARLSEATGLRMGEVMGVTINRIDFFGRRLTVDRQLVTPTSGTPYLASPKSEASNRIVPLPRDIVDLIAKHIAERGLTAADGEELVFVGVSGKPLRRGNVGEAMKRAVKKSGISREATWHDWRHRFASLLIREHQDPVIVQAMLGHASSQETHSTYLHLWPDALERARDAVESALNAARSLA